MKRFYVANKVIRELQLSSKAINVYDYLCMCVDKNSECFPNKRTIASHCSISVASVTRALRELEKAKMISTVARFEYVKCEKSYIRQTSNIYHIYETPQTQNDDTSSIEPLKGLKAEPTKVPEQPELCACETAQDEIAIETENVENGTNNKAVDVLTNEQFNKTEPVIPNDILLAQTDKAAESKAHKTLITYYLFSTLLLVKSLFLCPFSPHFDMPPRVTVTRQGTRTKLKVTDNFRNKSVLSKLTKWYRLHKYTKLAG